MPFESPIISKEHALTGLNEALLQAETPDLAYNRIVTYFHGLRNANPDLHIGLISGRVSGIDDDAVKNNKARLVMYSNEIGIQKPGAVIFSCPEAFSDEAKTKIKYETMGDNRKRTLWQQMVLAGIFTDIYMTPGWEKSEGAWLEYEAARNRKDVAIHFIIDSADEPPNQNIQTT